MKGILEFDLNDPDESEAFKTASRASDYQLFIWDFYQDFLRKYDKHGVPDRFRTPQELISHLRDEFDSLHHDAGLIGP